MVSEARCEVCGRPWDGGTLLSREIPCQGCHGEYAAAVADGKSTAEARQLAYNAHVEREKAAGLNQRYLWLMRNEAGLHAITGEALDTAKLAAAGLTLKQVKDRATAKLAALDAEASK